MLSLLSRTAVNTISAARARSAAACRPLATAATPHVTGQGKLARRGAIPLDWKSLDAAVSNRSEQLRNEKQHKSGPTSVAETWANLSDKAVARLGPPPGKYAGTYLRASMPMLSKNHVAGRSVEVQRGDLAGALRRLNGILFENRVHAERVRNLRHEKKGYKRRRLASERWRRRFAHEVCHLDSIVWLL